MADIGQRLWIRPPSVTGVVDRLERQGLLKRSVSASDLRTKEVSLTPDGEGLVQRIMSVRHEHVRSLMSGFGAKERNTLVMLLNRLADRLDALAGAKKD